MKNKVVIVGGGVSGLTASIYLSRFGVSVTTFTNGSFGSLADSPKIENFPGFDEDISGLDLVLKMQNQAEKFGCKIENSGIIVVNFREKFAISEAGEKYDYDAIIFATGMTHKKFPESIKGSEEFKNHIHYCAVCDGNFYSGRPVVVVGGGDTALTEALYLSNICESVSLIVRRTEFRASASLANSVKQTPNIYCKMGAEITEISGKDGKIVSVHTSDGDIITTDCIFSSIGFSPNDKLFSGHEQESGVFICGDCKQNKYRQAVVAAGEGAKAAIDANEYLMSI